MTFVWAYLAGTLTLINPCVLPLLPIVLATAFQNSRLGPLTLAVGMTVSFTAMGTGVTAFGHLVGVDSELINRLAAFVMLGFGLVLVVPKAQHFLSILTSPFASSANEKLDRFQGAGLAGQFMVGVLLGAVWSPCIGPTLGGAIGLAASGDNLAQASATMLVFSIGVSTILMSLAYGSREILASRRQRLMQWMPLAKPIMGAALLLVGLAVLLHVDKMVESLLLDLMPIWLLDLSVSI